MNSQDTIENFYSDNMSALRQTLDNQFKSHFDYLVQQIPSITKVQWSNQQIDEDCYVLTDFALVKENGYSYSYVFDCENENGISSEQFNPDEIILIEEFITYLSRMAFTTIGILGSNTIFFSV